MSLVHRVLWKTLGPVLVHVTTVEPEVFHALGRPVTEDRLIRHVRRMVGCRLNPGLVRGEIRRLAERGYVRQTERTIFGSRVRATRYSLTTDGRYMLSEWRRCLRHEV